MIDPLHTCRQKLNIRSLLHALLWQNHPSISKLLLPLAYCFGAVTSIRRWILTRLSSRIACPIIVIGNITLGGSGKTTLCIWLARYLSQQGLRVGIISRGYLASPPLKPLPITANTPCEHSGDEAKLIHLKTNCPVMIDINRVRAATALMQQYKVQVIISDDGLQHYRLPRNYELIVMNQQHMHLRPFLIPSGPFRETPSRLKEAYCVLHCQTMKNTDSNDLYAFHHKPCAWKHSKTGKTYPLLPVPFDQTQTLSAACSIGNPEGFFSILQSLGLTTHNFTFDDHTPIPQHLLQQSQVCIITEKDWARSIDSLGPHVWTLMIEAELTPLAFKRMKSLAASLKTRLIEDGS